MSHKRPRSVMEQLACFYVFCHFFFKISGLGRRSRLFEAAHAWIRVFLTQIGKGIEKQASTRHSKILIVVVIWDLGLIWDLGGSR